MEKYSEKQYRALSKEEKGRVFDLIMESIFIQRREIDNITYIELLKPGTGQKLLLEDVIVIEAERLIDEYLQQYLSKKDIKNSLELINIVFRLFYNEEKIKSILSNADIDLITGMYVRFYEEMKKRNIDIFEFIDSEKLYEQLKSKMMTLTLQKYNTKSVGLYMKAIQQIRNILDAEVMQQGGIDIWISNREKKKIADNQYRKDYLVESIVKAETTMEDKEKYTSLLLKQGFCTKDMVALIELGQIEPTNVVTMYNIKSLRRFVIEAMGKIQLHNAVIVFSELEDTRLLGRIYWNKVKWEELKNIRETDGTIGDAIIAKVIINISERGEKVTEGDIDYIFKNTQLSKTDAMRAWFELVKAGLYNEDKIINVYEEQVDKGNQENPYQDISEQKVTSSELLSYFNSDKVVSKLEIYCNAEEREEVQEKKDRFLNFYLGLLESNRIVRNQDTELIIEELSLKLREGISGGEINYLLIAIELFEKRIIGIPNMQQILNEENQEIVIDLYGNGIDDNALLKLYKLGLLQGYIIELLYQEIGAEQLREKIQNHEISIQDTVILYFSGIIKIEELGNEKIEAVDWTKILRHVNILDSKIKISELYKNGNIGFEEIRELKELGVLGAKEAESILNQLDLESILMSGLTSGEGIGEKGKRRGIGSSRKREGILLEDRDVLLTNLGFKPAVNGYGQVLVVANGSFAGYRVYRDISRSFGVIIFENEIDGSSFIMHEAKAGEFIRTESIGATLVGSRSQWREKARTEGSVTAKLHTVQWGRNIINAIVDTSSTFKFDDEQARKQYVKTETQKLCEENKDTIDYLKMVKQEQLAK